MLKSLLKLVMDFILLLQRLISSSNLTLPVAPTDPGPYKTLSTGSQFSLLENGISFTEKHSPYAWFVGFHLHSMMGLIWKLTSHHRLRCEVEMYENKYIIASAKSQDKWVNHRSSVPTEQESS